MKKAVWSWCSLMVLGAGLIGCNADETPPAAASSTPDTTYIASSEPAGAVPVGDARKSAEDADEVVLVGRIGGSANPFIEGVAAFTIVDPKVPHCSAEEGCPTPWDYCCEQNQVQENIAMVKVTDDQGKPVAKDARQLLGVKELNLVVVHGKAQRDPEGNLAVLADQVFVKE